MNSRFLNRTVLTALLAAGSGWFAPLRAEPLEFLVTIGPRGHEVPYPHITLLQGTEPAGAAGDPTLAGHHPGHISLQQALDVSAGPYGLLAWNREGGARDVRIKFYLQGSLPGYANPDDAHPTWTIVYRNCQPRDWSILLADGDAALDGDHPSGDLGTGAPDLPALFTFLQTIVSEKLELDYQDVDVIGDTSFIPNLNTLF